jgi:hypothetical protein
VGVKRIHLVKGDIRPEIYVQLRQPDTLLDISKATVTLKIKPYKKDIVLLERPGELLPGTLQADLVSADLSQYPVPGSGGRVKFFFVEGNLEMPVGNYLGEIEVTFGIDNSFTAYTRLEFLIREDF